MPNSIYLVQRCIVHNRPRPELRFSEVAKLDYMGAAEYEFGAVPTSLRSIAGAAECYQLVQVEELCDDHDAPLWLYSRFVGADLQHYLAQLKQLRAGKVRCKSPSHFDNYAQSRPTWRTASLWWDLGNDCLFSFDAEVMASMPSLMANSLVYMNAHRTDT